ncbi:MAG: hypothetical protein WC284_00035 [Candidimonas sp.]|jgi:hypothetical protein
MMNLEKRASPHVVGNKTIPLDAVRQAQPAAARRGGQGMDQGAIEAGVGLA